MKPRSEVGGYQHFGETYCLHLRRKRVLSLTFKTPATWKEIYGICHLLHILMQNCGCHSAPYIP